MSNLLALDQSSQVSGWSVFDKNTKKLVDYGSFTEGNPDFDTRLYHINRKVRNLIAANNITEVYLEDIQLQGEGIPNVVVYKRLAEVIGVICCLCAELNIPHTVVSPSTWRHTCGIRGKARLDKKRNAQIYVEQKYGIKVSDDIADAICIGEHAISQQNPDDWSN